MGAFGTHRRPITPSGVSIFAAQQKLDDTPNVYLAAPSSRKEFLQKRVAQLIGDDGTDCHTWGKHVRYPESKARAWKKQE
jgi:hypothetical protein